jgi:O-glycosyl hydrolase
MTRRENNFLFYYIFHDTLNKRQGVIMNMLIKLAFASIFPLFLMTCGSAGGGNAGSGNVNGTIRINYNEFRQVIDGFGGSNAWTGLPSDRGTAEELVKLLYSRTEGMGFTILRNRIPFRERLPGDDTPQHNDGFLVRNSDHTYRYTTAADGTKTFSLNWNSWDLSNTRNLIRQIQALGNDGPEDLLIFSTPWTPPNNRVTRWKEDVTGVYPARLNGAIDWSRPDVWGRLRREVFADYADLLADYVSNFEERMGAPLAILSIQNEPNWKVEYESAYWSGEDFRDFLIHVNQRFPRKGITLGEGGLGIMIPEFENFNINFDEMIKPSLDVPEVNRIISHIALHQYNGAWDPSPRAGAKEFPEILETGKRFWQTEVSGSGPHLPAGAGIDNALYYARMIHFDFTLVQMNAFLFWWLWTNGGDLAGALIRVEDGDTIIPSLRLFAMGQYSRFIRPGWHRIESDTEVINRVYSSAYRSPDSNEIAIVIINDRTSAQTVSLDLEGAVFSELALWRTSANESLQSIGRQNISRNTANVTLPPKSISTFYGRVR